MQCHIFGNFLVCALGLNPAAARLQSIPGSLHRNAVQRDLKQEQGPHRSKFGAQVTDEGAHLLQSILPPKDQTWAVTETLFPAKVH